MRVTREANSRYAVYGSSCDARGSTFLVSRHVVSIMPAFGYVTFAQNETSNERGHLTTVVRSANERANALSNHEAASSRFDDSTVVYLLVLISTSGERGEEGGSPVSVGAPEMHRIFWSIHLSPDPISAATPYIIYRDG